MQRDDRVFLMGEEVGVYQGAYKVSKGLLQEFGEMRVVDTPITELGFAGVGVGAAMVGLRPVIEFMTWNFAVLALDQVLNSAAKMLYMSGGQYPCPIVSNGEMALVAMPAADQLAKGDIRVDVVDLRTVRPMDVDSVKQSVAKTNRAVVLEEGWELAGIGAQVVDYVQRECFDHLDAA